MLTLYRSTDLHILAGCWFEKRHNNPPDNPLLPAQLIVQNYGMGRWFSLYKARKEGIAANLKIEFPAERMWSLFRLLYPDIPRVLPSDKEPMAFSIMDILEKELKTSSLQPLYEYIENDFPPMRALRSWKLSNRIADLFDQYLIYRPQMLLNWQKHQTLTGDTYERWQAALWRTLQEQWKQGSDDVFSKHRAELHRDLLQAIEERSFSEGQLPPLTIFGLTSMPPVFLKTFVKLSACTDIQCYILDAARPGVSVHPMVKSLGGEGAAFLDLFYRFVEEDDKVKAGFSEHILEAPQRHSSTVLSKFQKLISEGRADTQYAEISADASLQIHACHSPLREVEVLYDQLLALFDENPLLKPDDIVIMLPDIETYAPLIDAVFGITEEGLPEIPYRINDRSFSQKSPAVEAFLKVLEISQSRFKVTDVMDLLHLPAIRKGMQATHEDINRIEKWVMDNNIRWGIDGSFKAKYGLPEDVHFTWQSGLSRMMLGYAMQRQQRHLYDGWLPYDQIEGADSTGLLGTLDELLQKLFMLHEQTARKHTVKEWIGLFKSIVQNFLPEADEENFEVNPIRKVIEKLGEVTSLIHFEHAVPCSVMQSYITAKLEQQQRKGSYMGHGVTFCAMAPMRGIPFKVVGLLGMDEGAYPGQKPVVEFDLLRRYPSQGDPDQAKEDRYIFLETVLAARQTLYISYTGQSNRRDVTLPPSVLVSELSYALQDSFKITAEKLLTKHRLQAFSPKYFRTDSQDLFSYSSAQLATAKKLVKDSPADKAASKILFGKLPEPEEDQKEVTLQQLIAFFQHPAKYVLQHRLGIYLREQEIADEDREIFHLQGLDRYYVKDELFEELLKGRSLEGMQTLLQAKELLPAGSLGEWAFKEQAEAATHFYRKIQEEVHEPSEPLEIDNIVEADGHTFHLTGKIDEIYPDGLLLYRFGKMRAKDRISWWLKQLAWSAEMEQRGYSRFYTYDSKKERISMEEMKIEGSAHDILKNLLLNFWRGLQQPFAFFPESSYAFSYALLDKGKPVKEALGEANKKWEENKHSHIQEQKDGYIRIIFKNYNLMDNNEFMALSKRFWRPYLKSIIKS